MTNEERDLNPEPESTDGAPTDAPLSDDDLRYAPPLTDAADAAVLTEDTESAADDFASPPPADEDLFSGGLDIGEALAAVSTLSDMLAEQEAAEQARIAQAEADAQARAERQARLEHPERFFPVPPMTTLRRGQMASVVPAVLLILLGAGLTLLNTTSSTALNAGLIAGGLLGAVALMLLSRWLASGRWARGTFFGGVLFLLTGGVLVYLLQPGSLGFTQGWPLLLAALGLTFILSAFLAYPTDRRLIFPGLVFLIIGIIALVLTLGVLDTTLVSTITNLWPVGVALIALLWLLPVIFRQRG